MVWGFGGRTLVEVLACVVFPCMTKVIVKIASSAHHQTNPQIPPHILQQLHAYQQHQAQINQNTNPQYQHLNQTNLQHQIPPHLQHLTNQQTYPLQPQPPQDLTTVVQSLIQKVDNMQTGGKRKHYSFEDICPYPFDRTLYMPPFPKNFETPKFDKCKGKGDPRDHLREFYIACLEVSNNDTYLMRFFPRSLGGQAVEWFAHLPPGIRTFPELAKKSVNYFSYNFEHEISMTDLCNTKQKNGEAFASFLQRWRSLASKLPWLILEK